MKLFNLLSSVSCFLFISPILSIAQQLGSTITFIRLNSNIGYVIDVSENKMCNCINYAGSNFKYGALVQLPDSNIVFRMKIEGRDNFINVPLSELEVAGLSRKAADAQLIVSDEKAEQTLLKEMAGDITGVRLIDYFELKYKTPFIQRDSVSVPVIDYSNSYSFINIGVGFSFGKGDHDFYMAGVELGYVLNQIQVFTVRLLGHKEPKAIFGNTLPGERIFEAGLLYGRKFNAGLVSFTLNAGVMYASGIFKGKLISRTGGIGFGSASSRYESVPWNSLGIPVKAEMLLGNSHKSIVSIAMFANINVRHSYEGILFCLRPSGEYRK